MSKSSFKGEMIGLIISVLIILGIVISFVAYNQYPITTGKRIVLDTRPVDPFSPLRGQLMARGYEISRINDSGFKEGDTIYVSLEEDEKGIWRYVDASKVKPDRGDFIRGDVERVSRGFATVQYGIEQYFFEAGAEIPTQNITVEVAVANSGRAKIIQLLQNGEPVVIKDKE